MYEIYIIDIFNNSQHCDNMCIIHRLCSFQLIGTAGIRDPYKQVGRGSSVGIAYSLGAGRSRDRIPVEARFSAPTHTRPGVHTASYTMNTESFPGVKRPGGGIDHSPHLPFRLKERVELHIYYSSGLSWLVLG